MLQTQLDALESVRTIAEARVLGQWVIGEDSHWLFMRHDKATGSVTLVRSGMDGVTQFTVQYFLLSFELADADTSMSAELRSTSGTWRSVADSANLTVDIAPGTKQPTETWCYRMMLAEHSPIRKIHVDVVLHNLKSWVSVHLVRHKFGIEHWVRSQRSDRTGVPRDKLPQDSRVNHEFEANAQALISISRKRLCHLASPETQEAWSAVRDAIMKADPTIAKAMVPSCIYRGYCYEMKSCGYFQTKAYQEALWAYRRLPNGKLVNEDIAPKEAK